MKTGRPRYKKLIILRLKHIVGIETEILINSALCFSPLHFLMKVVDHLDSCVQFAALTPPHKYIYLLLPHKHPHLYPAVLIFMAREAIVLACDVTARLIHPRLDFIGF